MREDILDMKLRDVFKLNYSYKISAITMLINVIAEDRAYDAMSHLQTEKEMEINELSEHLHKYFNKN